MLSPQTRPLQFMASGGAQVKVALPQSKGRHPSGKLPLPMNKLRRSGAQARPNRTAQIGRIAPIHFDHMGYHFAVNPPDKPPPPRMDRNNRLALRIVKEGGLAIGRFDLQTDIDLLSRKRISLFF